MTLAFTMNTRSAQRMLLASSGLKSLGIDGTTSGANTDPGMRIGEQYQAAVPDLQPGSVVSSPGSVLLWQPTDLLTNHELTQFVKLAHEQHGYSIDQALGMLYFHSYDTNSAMSDLTNFCPLQDEWTMEDKVIFEQAFHYHGKNFQRIRIMLPDKPVSSLVKYYYLWKRSYSQYSVMEKHSHRNSKRISVGLPVSNDDNDSNQSGSGRSLGDPPPILPSVQLVGKGKQLPKGIHLSAAQLSTMATDLDGIILLQLETEIQQLMRQVQTNKQELAKAREQLQEDTDLEVLRPKNYAQKSGAPARWSPEEIHVALEVIQQNGKDAVALSDAITTKSVAQCRNFFTNYKRKLNLPRLIAEYEIRHGHKLSRYSRQAGEQLRNEQLNNNLMVRSGRGPGSNLLNLGDRVGDDESDEEEIVPAKRPRMAPFMSHSEL